MFTTSPYASNPNLLVANDVATGFLELKISSSSSSCEKCKSVSCPIGWVKGAYCSVLGLWNEEEDDYRLNTTPCSEDNICLPADLLKTCWPSELIEQTG